MAPVFDNLRGRSDSRPDAIRKLYDEWADDYDATLTAWGYEAPTIAAGRLAELVPAETLVLDAGCGTGLSGQALYRAGFHTLVGVDFSAESLVLAARRRVYRDLLAVDLTQPPLPFADGAFGAVVCVGVLSYLPEVEAICRDFCRLTRPGGAIVLTQRSDLFGPRGTQQAFDRLVGEGLWQPIEVTGPEPYLPGNPEFEGIGVRYGVFRRA
ncbi:MAG: class I SAM-dependent methyltransferase [Alphaproteobacteria bacterium]|nr:class I SAM-dependent methyltransferase [Alphaproteobacteria bacterium]MCB9930614.1 class I SAM-dependent methyltransferase [Alphaproteobacteria bacterium]